MKSLRTSALTSLMLCAALWASNSTAQYKWIDQDGKVNYSDRPPDTPAKILSQSDFGARGAANPADTTLPVALKTAVTRFPVMLFTTPGGECVPCTNARSHLTRRGVPFSEKTLATEADIGAFRQLGFKENGVPALSVGRERLVGYDTIAWDRLLDAGGYPKTSMLPPGYKSTPPAPLAAPRPEAGALASDAAGAATGSATDEPFFKATRPLLRPANREPAPVAPPSAIRF